jgi:hypothetical protein
MAQKVILSGLTAEDLNMPWSPIIQGAAQCESGRRDGSVQCDATIELPCNLVYSVLTAMNANVLFDGLPCDEDYDTKISIQTLHS